MKKRRPGNFPDIKRLLPSRAAVVKITVLLVLFFSLLSLDKILKKLDYFRIKDIIVKAQGVGDFSYIKGSNIFDIDLEKESRYISGLCPDFKNVRLIRVLPDKLFIDFTRRNAIACVKLHRYMYMDEDFSLFDLAAGEPAPDLPLVQGLEKRIFGARAGRRYNIPEFVLAMDIIKEKNLNPALNDYRIRLIDVANLGGASFFLSYSGKENRGMPGPDLEIKTGQGNIKEKMNILASLFSHVKDRADNIKYIDLRFNEPVIKLK